MVLANPSNQPSHHNSHTLSHDPAASHLHRPDNGQPHEQRAQRHPHPGVHAHALHAHLQAQRGVVCGCVNEWVDGWYAYWGWWRVRQWVNQRRGQRAGERNVGKVGLLAGCLLLLHPSNCPDPAPPSTAAAQRSPLHVSHSLWLPAL